jgi:hypothetical protein
MFMTEISVTDAFGELITLFRANHQSVEFRRLINEFIDNRPLLGGIKIDHRPAAWVVTPQVGVYGEPSDGLVRCLSAAWALNQKRHSFGGSETHRNIPTTPISHAGFAKSSA